MRPHPFDHCEFLCVSGCGSSHYTNFRNTLCNRCFRQGVVYPLCALTFGPENYFNGAPWAVSLATDMVIRPFAALRPNPALAERICELPYDVMSSEEARALAKGNSLSFLHVSKPEIDLPPGTDIYSPQVYAKGKE